MRRCFFLEFLFFFSRNKCRSVTSALGYVYTQAIARVARGERVDNNFLYNNKLGLKYKRVIYPMDDQAMRVLHHF
ncbi:hypothetical protein BX666DRAFT_2002831 [Dichotomocladium elegans]|nr:hypothetical protein BX666DRAFT_2002831 [Dichotomocladium elegans]